MPSPIHRAETPESIWDNPFPEPMDFEIRDGFFVSSATPRPIGLDAAAQQMRRLALIFGGSATSTPNPSPTQIQKMIRLKNLVPTWSNDPDAQDYVGHHTGPLHALLARLFVIRVIQDHDTEDFSHLCDHERMWIIVNLNGTSRKFHAPLEIAGFFSEYRKKTWYTNITYDRGRVFCNVDITDVHHEWTDEHVEKIIVILDFTRNGMITRAELKHANDKIGPEAWEPIKIVRGTNTTV
ncbi:unnamed protein product [Colletotrichum noveboracense]|uniref:EF-hand domain-containing protein n=1 Tax=Colletotrichum noveboracense TaxID=2664923 RepID=A0A9W4S3L2_9PEZI|nr:unnamed protein product [Colletotrichum noveboracense]